MNPSDLMAQIKEAASKLLDAEGIYPVLDYGWKGEDTPSQEYVGLAMWTTDAPFEPDFNFWDRESPPPLPSERDDVFYRAGEDFFGTMKFARNALGSTLYCFKYGKSDNIDDDYEQFWEYRATAAVWLNIASDRLRDYFVMARFNVTSKEYAKQHKKNGIYARPFRIHDVDETPYAKSAAFKLVSVAERLDKLRQTRNEIVHSLASRRGHNAKILLKNQREEAIKSSYVPILAEAFTHSVDWNQTATVLSDARSTELRDAFGVLKDWYMLLVEASALTLEFEYWRRIAK